MKHKTNITPLPETKEARSRFRNTIGKYTIKRSSRCISCGLCAELCPYGVHPRYEKFSKSLRPVEHKCIGFKCKENDYYCIDRCPEKALTLRLNPVLETLGDYRWTAEMLLAHWEMAETGKLPTVGLEYNLGCHALRERKREPRSAGAADRASISRLPQRAAGF